MSSSERDFSRDGFDSFGWEMWILRVFLCIFACFVGMGGLLDLHVKGPSGPLHVGGLR